MMISWSSSFGSLEKSVRWLLLWTTASNGFQLGLCRKLDALEFLEILEAMFEAIYSSAVLPAGLLRVDDIERVIKANRTIE